MKMRRVSGIMIAAVGLHAGSVLSANAQCCLTDLFAGCGACMRKPPVYAVAPVMAPVMAPVAAPPAPVMVPVQQTSYVPETTYRTQYQSVPVTTYKPSCEVDPCTGCTRECMQPVTQYVQQAVNVPVTQYRAVTTTKYVQMQPGYGAGAPPGAYPAAQPAFAAPVAGPSAVAPAPVAGTFAPPVQTTPQAWGAAGADIPQQIVPSQPALPPATMPQQTYQPYQQPIQQQPYQQQPIQQPYQQPYQQPIAPQSGAFVPAAPAAVVQPQPTQPPALAPTPSLKPIPELPRNGGATGSASAAGSGNGGPGALPVVPPSGTNGFPAPSGTNGTQAPAPAAQRGMPVLPGEGPKASTNAFPRLLEPTSHTTSWQPAMLDGYAGRRPGYPTAALPARLQQ